MTSWVHFSLARLLSQYKDSISYHDIEFLSRYFDIIYRTSLVTSVHTNTWTHLHTIHTCEHMYTQISPEFGSFYSLYSLVTVTFIELL